MRPQRRPIWQPSRLARLRAFLKSALSHVTLKRFAIVLFGLPLVLYLYREIARDVLIIDPIAVPKQFEESGLTSEVMASRISNAMRQIESEAKTRMKKDNLSLLRDEGSTPDIEIPGTKLGLKSLVDITRTLLDVYPRHVSGDIVVLPAPTSPSAKSQVRVTIYVTSGKHRNQSASVDADPSDLESLATTTAEMILVQINPYILAVHRLDHGKMDDANRILNGIIADASQNDHYKSGAFILLGTISDGQKKYDEAIAKYQKAVELNPKSALPYTGWGVVLADQGKYDEAIAKYRRAIELDPKFAAPYNGWAYALSQEGKYDEAIAKYQKAIELDPMLAVAYTGWAYALSQEGKHDEATAKYQKAIELDPMFAVAYTGWAYALSQEGKYDEAIAMDQKAIELNPKLALPYILWGNHLSNEGKYDEAIAKYQNAIDLDPKSALPYTGWAFALQAQKKYDGAIAKFQKAIELDPEGAPRYAKLVIDLQTQKTHEKVP